MSWIDQKEDLEDKLVFLRQFIRPVPDDEKAMAHIVCPNVFAIHSELMKWVNTAHTNIAILEDRIEEDRQERAEMRAEYKLYE